MIENIQDKMMIRLQRVRKVERLFGLVFPLLSIDDIFSGYGSKYEKQWKYIKNIYY